MQENRPTDDSDALALARQVDAIRDEFEAALCRGAARSLAAWLPPAEPARTATLLELAPLDIRHRLERGEPARVEEYLARHPELAGEPDAVAGLVAVEYTCRREREPDLD